jgi:AraC family transcriptional regulator
MGSRLPQGQFYGETVRSREVAGLLLAQSAYAPGTRIPAHAHENAFFYVVLQGTCTETCGPVTRTARPSTLVFHPSGSEHANDWHGGVGLCFHIEVTRALLERVQGYGGVYRRSSDHAGGLLPWLALRLYREFGRAHPLSPLVMEGLALELLAEAGRVAEPEREREAPRWLGRVRERLHAEFATALHVDDVARSAGVHPCHLARVVRRHWGCTVGDYVRKLRVEWACRELAASDRPLVEVALAAGFADQSHFTKAFKQAVGMTPGEFRRTFGARKSHTTG